MRQIRLLGAESGAACGFLWPSARFNKLEHPEKPRIDTLPIRSAIESLHIYVPLALADEASDDFDARV
jgi:hypothetical protein